MTWKEQLKKLESAKQWDFAIDLMQEVIAHNPHDMDAYMSMNFLLMNLLVEEEYDTSKHDYYAHMLKKYFDESYAKFSHNPEYLYYMGKISCMSEWYIGLEQKDTDRMLSDALLIEPDNILYQYTDLINLDMHDPKNKNALLKYANMVLQENSPIKTKLLEKGSMGEYLLDLMINYSKEIVSTIKQ